LPEVGVLGSREDAAPAGQAPNLKSTSNFPSFERGWSLPDPRSWRATGAEAGRGHLIGLPVLVDPLSLVDRSFLIV
jgi:hypothetical protein